MAENFGTDGPSERLASSRGVYLDAAASTPLDPEVLAAMLAVFEQVHANPSSAHWAGRQAHQLVHSAREQVGSLVGRSAGAVVFTGGATEANNLVLRGLRVPTSSTSGGRRTIISTRAEHPSALRALHEIAAGGVPVRLLDVDTTGQVDLDELRDVVDDTTLLVSVMAANNETGTLADLVAIANVAHEAGALVHTDATQLLAWGALGGSDTLITGLDPLDLDLVTVSAHKMHGPQGVGALVASAEARRLLTPVTAGGGQENGLRSGTTNVAGVVGFGTAAERAMSVGPTSKTDVAGHRDTLHQRLVDALAPVLGHSGHATYPQLNGHRTQRLPGVLNLAFGDDGHALDAEEILARTPALAASTGSACQAGMPEPSPVLLAMGHSIARAQSSIRLSLSRLTTDADVTLAASLLAESVRQVSAETTAHESSAPSIAPGRPGTNSEAPGTPTHHRKVVTS